MRSQTKKHYQVTMRRTIRSAYTTDLCTADEARNNPFDHISDSDELEIEQIDYEVESVKENK